MRSLSLSRPNAPFPPASWVVLGSSPNPNTVLASVCTSTLRKPPQSPLSLDRLSPSLSDRSLSLFFSLLHRPAAFYRNPAAHQRHRDGDPTIAQHLTNRVSTLEDPPSNFPSLLIEVDQIYHLACPASPIFNKYNPVKPP